MRPLKLILVTLAATTAAVAAHSHGGGLDAAGCHAGTQPYHCHNDSDEAPKPATSAAPSSEECTLVKGVNTEGYETLTGPLTRVVDGDTIKLCDVSIRLAALDAPELNEDGGQEAKQFLAKFEGSTVMCELTGATAYDRLVGYCQLHMDIGLMMMRMGLASEWSRYDVWSRY